jgi:hypothetical protein
MHLHKLSVRLSSAALLLLAAAAPVAAADPAAPASNQAAVAPGNHASHATKPAADEPKLICRHIGNSTSRLQTKKVCLTREQWRNVKYN